ncbi:MAG: hypothetical protein HQL27_08280, partial [Candidatus Omnitrophica bacterium]|nr:hypothetical protein [Candidatus Omnitrophota bacterium]
MPIRFYQKLSQYTGLLLLGAIFGIVAFTAKLEVRDLDLWLHLGTGKYITENKVIPKVDILSCSIQGKPWVNHEWLFQVIAYGIYEKWNAEGLLMMQVFVVTVAMLFLLFIGYSSSRQLIVSVFLFMVYFIFQQRFTIRPDIFSLMFFAMYIYVLALHLDKKWSVPLLFLAQVFWVNIH